MAIQITNFINGEFVPYDLDTVTSTNPSTGKDHAIIPDSNEATVNAAVDAAKAAFPAWAKTSPTVRAEMCLKIADLLEARLEEFAEAESADQGKPLWLATKVDIPRACYNFRFFAKAIGTITERSHVHDSGTAISYSMHQPVGVAGLITPWNLPLYLLTWKIAPALVFGNTIVAKPSEITSVTAWKLCRILQEVLPPGVCNMVFGTGPVAGKALVTHPNVQLISFTGGTLTGQKIRELTSSTNKKLSLELGGKNPSLIFDDVDAKKVAAEVVRSSFTNQGEICLCSSRIYVQEKIYDKFCSEFAEATKALTVGPPSHSGTKLGALVSKQHWEKVQSFVALAKQEGATFIAGDEPLDLPAENKEGYFMRPVVLTDVSEDSRLIREEIFGPVVSVIKFHTEAEAIEKANDCTYGLAACVWSKDGARATRIAHELDAGTIWINCWMVRDLNMPFGGLKGSGTGRESALDSMEFFTEAKTICSKFC